MNGLKTRGKLLELVVCSSLFLATTTTGCRKGTRTFLGPASHSSEVKVTLEKAVGEHDELEVIFVALNKTDYDILIDRNQIAVVASKGEQYRRGPKSVLKIPPQEKLRFGFRIKNRGIHYRSAKGLYFRLDGFYLGEHRIQLPPIKAGKPDFEPGEVNTAFRAPHPSEAISTQKEPTSLVGYIRRAARNITGSENNRASSSRAAPPPPSGDGWQEYRGPRARVRSAGVSCAAIPLEALKLDEQTAFIIDEIFLSELQQAGFQAIGPEDVNQMLGFEQMKDAAGCDDAVCIAEIGGALGVDYLAAGKVTVLDGVPAISIKLIAVRDTAVIARATKMGREDKKELPRLLGEAVQDLVKQSKL